MKKTPLIIIAALVTLLAAAFTVVLILRPLPGADSNHQCRGTHPSDCAPCACVSALSYFGVITTQYEMIPLCGTIASIGSYRDNVLRALQVKGMSCVPVQPEAATATGAVCVVGYIIPGGDGHCVCLHGDGTGCTVNDPAQDNPDYWTLKQVGACQWIVQLFPAPKN